MANATVQPVLIVSRPMRLQISLQQVDRRQVVVQAHRAERAERFVLGLVGVRRHEGPCSTSVSPPQAIGHRQQAYFFSLDGEHGVVADLRHGGEILGTPPQFLIGVSPEAHAPAGQPRGAVLVWKNLYIGLLSHVFAMRRDDCFHPFGVGHG